jgi:hypothetical protein
VTRRLALALCAAAGILLSGRTGFSADVAFPSHQVHVELTIADDGKAEVREEYALTGPVAGSAFQFLNDPCSTVGPVAAGIDDHPVALRRDAVLHGPWTFFHADTAAEPGRGAVYRVRYEVSTRGTDVAVPILTPATTLEAAAGVRGARVDLVARWRGPSGGARVAVPRLDAASSPDVWQATLLAMPSTVRVDLTSATRPACAREFVGTTGGLEWRFIVFVATMAIWVQAYLWWFGRRWARGS